MKQFIRSILVIFFACSTILSANDDFIVVNKKNVEYRFAKFDAETDNFTQNKFWDWENETFEVFDEVKDSNAIAIDLGAWIGTTSIWLAKNFYHVLALEPDVKSLICLRNNLEASDCSNVSICERPVSRKSEPLLFGPRGAILDESISRLKNGINNANDYVVQAFTFKQLVYDYIYANETLNTRQISFIKCDVEGGEEDILEDILHFAYNNHCSAYISFHIDWWKNKNIRDYHHLFEYFDTNCPQEDICGFLAANPFASILFKPREDRGVLLKKNMPVFVIGYNQYTFIKNMVKQLEKYTSDISVIDNNSDYQPLLDYYKNDYHYTLLKQKGNYGHRVYSQEFIQRLAGDLYVLTDPDLEFNPKLPDNFFEDLINISNYYAADRVGFALLIDSDDIREDIRYTDITNKEHSIKEWERPAWNYPLQYPPNPDLELYSASLETTFCLINRRFNNPSIRVAGDFTCKHIPWHKNFQEMLQEGESESYMKNNVCTNWYKH